MGIEQYQAHMRQMVREHGWIVQGVYPSVDDDPADVPFSYTIGLTTAGLPELILSGPFPPRTGQSLLNTAAQIHCKNEIKPGDLVEGVANLPMRAIAARVGDHVQQALNFYDDIDGNRGRVRLVQLLWPSKEGKWPDQDAEFATIQEVWL